MSYWAKTYGQKDCDECDVVAVAIDQNGDIIVAEEMGGIIRFDDKGNIKWSRIYLDACDDLGLLPNGDIIAVGRKDGDATIIKLSPEGRVIWAKKDGDDSFNSVTVAPNGDIIVAGSTESFGAGDRDVWILRLDADGNVKWQKTYRGPSDEWATAVALADNGDIIVAGYTYSFGAGGWDAWVLRLDSKGNVKWQKTYRGSRGDGAYAVAVAPNGDIIIAGDTRSFGAGTPDYENVWIIRLDSEGRIIWQKTYSVNTEGGNCAFSTAVAPNGDIIVTGSFTMKLDANGNVIWAKNVAGMDVAVIPNGDIVIAGNTNSFGTGGRDIWLLRLPPDGELKGFSRNSKAKVEDSKAEVHDTNVKGVEGRRVETVEVEKEVWVDEVVPVQKEVWVTEGKIFKKKVKKTITVNEKRKVKKKIKTTEERVVKPEPKDADIVPREWHPTIMVQYDSEVKAFVNYWTALSEGNIEKAAEALEELSRVEHLDPHLILLLIEFKAFIVNGNEDEKDVLIYLKNNTHMEVKCRIKVLYRFKAQPLELTLKPGGTVTKTVSVKKEDKDKEWKGLKFKLSLPEWEVSITREVEVLGAKDYRYFLALQEESALKKLKLLREAVEDGNEKAKDELETLERELRRKLSENVSLSAGQLVEGRTSTAELVIANPLDSKAILKGKLDFNGKVRPGEFRESIPAGGKKKIRLELTPKTYGNAELKLRMSVEGIEIEKSFHPKVKEHPARKNLPRIIDVFVPSLVEDFEGSVKVMVTNTLAESLKLTLDFSANDFLEIEEPTLELPALSRGKKVTKTLTVRPKYAGSFDFKVKIKAIADGIELEDEKIIPIEVKEKMVTPATPVTPQPATPVTPSHSYPSLTSFPAELLSVYEPLEELGKGGFARVYKVKRKKDGEVVAVKIPLSLDPATGKSFLREIENWVHLRHPNIVRVYDYNILPVPFFEMEYCESSLEKLPKPLKSEQAALLIFNIAEGLKYAHSKGIIHRDLKPSNILLKNGVPKISDWGLSKVTKEGRSTTLTSFTALYTAPEQISRSKFGKTDERTDIWQLGVIFYELLTGRLPFEGDDLVELGFSIIRDEPLKPSELNPEAEPFDGIVMRCLAKNKEERYESAAELQGELALIIGMDYRKELKKTVANGDLSRSAYYAGELVLIHMKLGDLAGAYKYLGDLEAYARSEVREEVSILREQVKVRLEQGLPIPEELVEKAEIVVHKVKLGFQKL